MAQCQLDKYCTQRTENYEGAHVEVGYFCVSDRTLARQAVLALPKLRDQLAAHIRHPASKGADLGVRVSGGSSEPSVPIRVDLDALMRQMDEVVFSWEEIVRDQRKLSDPSGQFDVACKTLHDHFDFWVMLPKWWINRWMTRAQAQEITNKLGAVLPFAPSPNPDEGVLCLPVMGWYGPVEVLTLYRKAIGALGLGRETRALEAPCPQCDLRGLKHIAGQDIVRCSCCGKVITYDDYEVWSKALTWNA